MAELEQYAALPFLRTERGLSICLITSRGTGRWVIPKGWPKASLAPHELAAAEARQEAGLIGTVDVEPLGFYCYKKRLHIFAKALCRVVVFPLAVEAQRLTWRERDQRQLAWMPVKEARSAVKEAHLAELIGALPTWLDRRAQATADTATVRGPI